jgi:hypothetical protein
MSNITIDELFRKLRPREQNLLLHTMSSGKPLAVRCPPPYEMFFVGVNMVLEGRTLIPNHKVVTQSNNWCYGELI